MRLRPPRRSRAIGVTVLMRPVGRRPLTPIGFPAQRRAKTCRCRRDARYGPRVDRGQAGTGKSFAIRAVRAGYEADRYGVIGLAPDERRRRGSWAARV